MGNSVNPMTLVAVCVDHGNKYITVDKQIIITLPPYKPEIAAILLTVVCSIFIIVLGQT